MSIAPDQLSDIYRQINDRFSSHPFISISPTQGDPPDQYDITYKITGFTQTDSGDIVEATEHEIELSIPFGFPHFPPSCRPKSIIYHPDFDPGAICIGDYWEQNPSIIDLIIQVGQMINGEFYSNQNAFNEKAAVWYEQNANKFPLSKISWDESGQAAADETHIEESLEDIELDTLDVEDLSFDFDDPLSNDEDKSESSLAELFPTVEMQLEGEEDLEASTLYDIQSRKEFFTLKKELEGQTEFSSELQVLLDDAEDIISQAEALHDEAKLLEKQGNASEALKKYKKIALMVSDYPAIQADINRLEQTLDLIEDLVPSGDSASIIEPDFIEEVSSAVSPVTAQEEKAASKPEPEQPKESRKSRVSLPSFHINKIYVLGSAVLIFLLVGGYYGLSFYAKSNLQKAQASYSSCLQAIEAKDFLGAKQLCDDGLALTDKVMIFNTEKAADVEKAITETLQSDEFTQGLAGKILVDGKYVSAKTAKLILTLQEKTEEAEKLYYKGNYSESATAFMAAVQLAEKVDAKNTALIERLDNKAKLAGFKEAHSKTKEHLEEKEWQLAIDSAKESQNRLMELPEEAQVKFGDELQSLIMVSNFEIAFTEGEEAIGRGEWDTATQAFNKSLDLALKIPSLEKSRLNSIENSLARADLYKTLENGNKAFATGDWNRAIDAYKKANEKLIQSGKSFSDAITSSVSKKKLSKIILQASIIRDKQSIQSMLDNDELHGAHNTYRNLLTLIESSALSGENEFTKIKADIRSQIQELDKKIYISDRKKYLEDNYQKLFAQNYENAVAENLTAPVIELVKDDPKSLVFRLQCTEKRRGRPLTLVMFYQYNKSSGKWGLSVGG